MHIDQKAYLAGMSRADFLAAFLLTLAATDAVDEAIGSMGSSPKSLSPRLDESDDADDAEADAHAHTSAAS